MRYPVQHVAIVQKFSNTHKGIDFGYYATKYKYQPILAVDDGEVIYKYTQTTGGKTIHIRHSNGLVSEYGHLNEFCVNKGDKVKKGQKIGTMGASGKVLGMHLHFGLYKGKSINYADTSKFINPLPYLCLWSSQEANTKSKLLYTINKTKLVKGVPSEPLNVRNKDNKVVYGFKNGQEVEYYGKTGDKAIVDKVLNYTTIAKYLK